MWSLIKKLFGNKQRKEEALHQVADSYDAVIKEREAEAAEQKRKWEAGNELKKKRDMAYLGTAKTAFYGTYEEWLQEKYRKDLAAFAQASSSGSFSDNAMRGQSQCNPYGYLSYGGGIFRI